MPELVVDVVLPGSPEKLLLESVLSVYWKKSSSAVDPVLSTVPDQPSTPSVPE